MALDFSHPTGLGWAETGVVWLGCSILIALVLGVRWLFTRTRLDPKLEYAYIALGMAGVVVVAISVVGVGLAYLAMWLFGPRPKSYQKLWYAVFGRS